MSINILGKLANIETFILLVFLSKCLMDKSSIFELI